MLLGSGRPPQDRASKPLTSRLSLPADFGETIPKSLKKRIKDPKKWPALAKELAEDRVLAAWLATTQAVDLIQGTSHTRLSAPVRFI